MMIRKNLGNPRFFVLGFGWCGMAGALRLGGAAESSGEVSESGGGALESSAEASESSAGAEESSAVAPESSGGTLESSGEALESSDEPLKSSSGAQESSAGASESGGGVRGPRNSKLKLSSTFENLVLMIESNLFIVVTAFDSAFIPLLYLYTWYIIELFF